MQKKESFEKKKDARFKGLQNLIIPSHYVENKVR